MNASARAGGSHRKVSRSRIQSNLRRAAVEALETRCLLNAPYIESYTAWGPEIGEGYDLSPGYENNWVGFSVSFLDDNYDSITWVAVTWPDSPTPEIFDNITNNYLEASHLLEEVDGPGISTYAQVEFEIYDSADEMGWDSQDLPIFNGPPTGTVFSNSPINEGSYATVSITNAEDPSAIDTAAGFRYVFGDNPSLSTTYNGTGTTTSNQMTFYYPDDVPYSTRYVNILDEDDGYTQYAVNIVAVNVAPFATLEFSEPDANGDVTVTLANVTDPSPVDTAELFGYSLNLVYNDLAQSKGAAGTSPSQLFSAADLMAGAVVFARVFDDVGYRNYQIGTTDMSAQVVSDSQINLTWTDSFSGANQEGGWRVQWSDDGSFAPGHVAYVNLPADREGYSALVPEGTRRWFRARAYSEGAYTGQSIYSPKMAQTTPILPPTDFAAAEVHADSVILEWTPQSTYETGFLLQKSTDGVNYDAGVELGPGTTWYDVTGLAPETNYSFRITTVGEDTNSTVASCSIRTLASAPIMQDISVSEVYLSWDLPDDPLGTIVFTPVTLSSGSSLVLERSINGGEFVPFVPGSGMDPSYQYIGLLPWEIEGRISAFRMYISDGSQRISEYSNVLQCSVAPNYPGFMSVQGNPTTDSVQLQWQDRSAHEDGYEILVTPADGSEAWIIPLDAGTSSNTVTGLDEASKYDFKVRAVSSGGASLWVAGVVYREPYYVPIEVITKLAAPTALDAIAANAVEVNLTWTDNADFEDGYMVEYWPTGVSGAHGIAYAPVNATGFPIIGLDYETTYTFKVYAYRSDVPGVGVVFSEPATATGTTEAINPNAAPPSDTPLPPGIYPYNAPAYLNRWQFRGDVKSAYLLNLGSLVFAGQTNWVLEPLILDAQYVFETVHGSIQSTDPIPEDQLFDDPSKYTYRFLEDEDASVQKYEKAFWVDVQTPYYAEITFEDSQAWWETESFPDIANADYAEGFWMLWRESMWTSPDIPSSNHPWEPPVDPPPEYKAPLDVVWITAEDADGSESPDSGQSTPGPITFRVSRWGPLDQSLTVELHTPAGTATSDDYTGMPPSVNIPADADHVDFTVTPVDDAVFEGTETIFAILKASNTYWLTTGFMAEGQIVDNDRRVTSVTWKTWSPDLDPSSPPASNDPWIANVALGPDTLRGGLRIFPDKQLPYDSTNHVERDPFASDRKKVIIEAQLDQAIANVPVYFGAFDIDSWEIGSMVDPNDQAVNGRMMLRGYDNRRTGDADPSHRGDAAVMNLSALTDAQGIARVTFSVTMQPGNNFRAFASTEQAVRDGLTQQFVDLYPTAPKDVPSKNGVPLLQSTTALTVWRKLHIEQDSMAAPQNEVFGAGSEPQLTPAHDRLADIGVDSLRTNLFNRAYIDVVTNVLQPATGQGLNPRRAATWTRALTGSGIDIGNAADAVRDVKAQDDFWVVQVIEGYTAQIVSPTGLSTPQGVHISGDSGSWIFVETVRRAWVAGKSPDLTLAEYQRRVVYHEALHAFGFSHNTYPGDSGVLNSDNLLTATNRAIEITPSQLNVMMNIARPN